MPSMPIDVSKVLSAITTIGQQRDLPSRVELVFDPTASNALVDKVIEAFVDVSSNAHVTDVVLDKKVPVIPKDTDLVIVIGGDSLLLGDVVHVAEECDVPAVVVIERGKTYFANDRRSAQAYADMTLSANTAPTLTGTAHTPGVGRGIDLENLVDLELDGESARPLEQLGTWIVQNVPSKRLSLARAFPFIRHPLAVELAKQTTIQNGAIGFVIVPGADMPLIALNQAKMVLQIAAVYGKEMNKERIGEVLAVIAGSFGCRAVARRLVAQVPVLSWVIKPAIAASGTMGMAIAAIEYYEENGKLHGLSDVTAKIAKKAAPVVSKGGDLVGNVVSGATAHK